MNRELRDRIKNEIFDIFKFWLPFVEVRRLDIAMSDINNDVGKNTMSISMDFNITRDPSTFESIEIIIGE